MKDVTERLLLNRVKAEEAIFLLFLVFLPTQLGKHFWPSFSFVSGLRIDYLSPTLYATDILIILLFISSFWNKSIVFPKSLWKILIATTFLLALFIRGFFSSSPLLALYGAIKLIEFFFLAFYVSQKKLSQGTYKKIAIIFFITILFESLLSIFQYTHQGSIGGLLYFFGERAYTGTTPGIANASIFGQLVLRPYGTFSHPNVLAGFLVVGMEIIGIICFQKIKKVQKLGLTCFAFGTLALFFTLSRTGILVWLGFVMVLVYRERKKLIGTFLIPIIVGLFLLFPFAAERFLVMDTHDESLVLRKELLESAFLMSHGHFFFGVGMYNFLPQLPSYLASPITPYRLQPVHNIFLYVFSETGIFGFLCFLAVLAYPLKKRNSFVAILVSILVIGFFDHYFVTIQQGQLLFSFILGLCYNKDSIV